MVLFCFFFVFSVVLLYYCPSASHDRLFLVSQGLVVPVIRGVEGMNFADIEKTINELGEKVRPLGASARSEDRLVYLQLEHLTRNLYLGKCYMT